MCSACNAVVACRTLRGKTSAVPPVAGSDCHYGDSALFSLSRRRKARQRRVAQSHSRLFEANRDQFNFSLRHRAVQPPLRRFQVEFPCKDASYPALVSTQPAEQRCSSFLAGQLPPRGSHDLPGMATCPITRWGPLRFARAVSNDPSLYLPL